MFAALVAIAVLGGVDLTVDEIDSLFAQNAYQSSTLRVDWRRTLTLTDEWRRDTDQKRDVLRWQLQAGEIPPQNRANVQKMVEAVNAVIPPARTIMQDYWSDRNRFQWRVLNDDAAGFETHGVNPRKVFHPDVESTTEELVSSLKDRLIITGGGAGLTFRTWFGSKRSVDSPFYAGAITFDVPASKGIIEFFPPLALPANDWPGVPNKIDLFFRPASIRTVMLGRFTLRGVSTQVVIKAWPRAKLGGGRPGQTWDVIRAYVDTGRGAIPLRVEGFVAGEEHIEGLFASDATPRSGELAPFPTWLVRDIDIKEVTRGFYYPVHGFSDDLGVSPESAGKIPTKLVPHQTVEWEAYRVDANRPMSSEMFDLVFPPNTIFRDERSNESRLTGDVDGFSELIVNRMSTPKPSFHLWSSPLFWTGFALVAATIFAVMRFYFRRTR